MKKFLILTLIIFCASFQNVSAEEFFLKEALAQFKKFSTFTEKIF